ncbi:MAG: hypothetical protein U0903_15615 [Planctomycetales bacterium]
MSDPSELQFAEGSEDWISGEFQRPAAVRITMSLFRWLKRSKRGKTLLCLILSAQMVGVGCTGRNVKQVTFVGEPRDLKDYRDTVAQISYPVVDEPTAENVAITKRPRTLRERFQEDQIWDMPLAEAIQISLANNKIVKRNDRGTIQGGSSQLMAVSDQASSVWDPAIQETGVLFGNKSVESALAAFDTQFTTNMLWGRNELIQNNFFASQGLGEGRTLVSETGQFWCRLTKSLVMGGSFSVGQTVNLHRPEYLPALQPVPIDVYRKRPGELYPAFVGWCRDGIHANCRSDLAELHRHHGVTRVCPLRIMETSRWRTSSSA